MSSQRRALQSTVNRVSCGSFGCNFGVNENCNVIILADKVKAAVMQSNDDLNEDVSS